MRFRRAYCAACVVAGGVWWLIGCTGAPVAVPDAAITDGGPDGGGDGRCVRDEDCDDHVFCDGVERCTTVADGGLRGCTSPGTSPCASGGHCDETMARCVTGPCAVPDADGDGVDAIACGGADCDDTDRTRYPGNAEVCDGVAHDEDCDPCTVASATTMDGDLDGDHFTSVVCANGYPGGPPLCDPATTAIDTGAMRVTGTDCDDMNGNVHPAGVEVCNGIDDNCNGTVDEGVLLPFYVDADGDGYGAAGSTPVMACNPPPMHVADDLDCDDAHAARNPAIREVCNGVDDNCDGLADNGDVEPVYYYADTDGDGHGDGAAASLVSSCAPPAGSVSSFDDCDDTAATVHPGAVELCDGRDTDCDGVGGAATEDADGDRHAPLGASCMPGYPLDDCDDTRAAVFGGAPEVCDGLDDDCDGAIDELPDATLACPVELACASAHCADVVGLAVGGVHTCVRRSDGTATCWGDNSSGELGDGTTVSRATPSDVVGVPSILQIVAGSTGTTCARTVSGAIDCWGIGGTRGDGDGTATAVPIAARLTPDAIDVDAGDTYVCALSGGGAPWCWGSGNGSMALPPMLIVGVSGAVEVAAGHQTGCALLGDGTVQCWGRNNGGELGRGTIDGSFHTDAAPVSGVTSATQLDADNGSACALLRSGAVDCWGGSWSTSTPTPVPGIVDAVEVATGMQHACARRAAGGVVCWGDNRLGQLGDGTTTSSTTPVAVLGIVDAVGLDAGDYDTCARVASGAVLCWGDNTYGQVGNGTTGGFQSVPAAVAGL